MCRCCQTPAKTGREDGTGLDRGRWPSEPPTPFAEWGPPQVNTIQHQQIECHQLRRALRARAPQRVHIRMPALGRAIDKPGGFDDPLTIQKPSWRKFTILALEPSRERIKLLAGQNG